VLHKNRRWCEAGDALLRAMDKLSFPDMWDEVIGGTRANISHNGLKSGR